MTERRQDFDASPPSERAIGGDLRDEQQWQWRSATEQEQEPLVERLAVMMFEVFETFHPPTPLPGESVEHFGSRVRELALSNIRAALRQVLVVTK